MKILEKLEGFELERAKKSLDLLLETRKNEFKELAKGMGIPVTAND